MKSQLCFCIVGIALSGCAHAKVSVGAEGADAARPAKLGQTASESASTDARCNAALPGRESSEYDTSGDGKPDVRKVFAALGDSGTARLVLICRESDLNGDGRKDIIRYSDDEGRPLREESDRNFDGKTDLATVYQDGVIVRQELDENYDAKIDTKIFFENGKATRAERDLIGRSTATEWRPNRWEYFENNRMVRMGTDIDGDARVDRWDRDQTLKNNEATAAAEGVTAAQPAEPVD